MQIQMDNVKAHIARTRNAHDRVQIRAVVINQTAGVVNDFCDFQNIFFKQAQCVGIRQHQRRGRFIRHRPQRFHIDVAFRVAWNLPDRKARHHRTGRIGSMSGIRHEHDGALIFMMAFQIVADRHQAAEFAMRARGRLEAERIHAGDLRQIFFQRCDNFQTALHVLFRRQRMDRRKALQVGRVFVDFRIVFHRAGA